MIINHPQICLFRPEIPQNTGNIGRIAAATQSRLHIVTPTGFKLTDKNLRRSGLDYWPFLDLEIHQDADHLFNQFDRNDIAFLSTKGTKSYLDIPKTNKLIVFGQETKGLPAEIHEKYSDRMFKLPLYHPNVRSLNIANTVAIVVYNQLEKLYGNKL